MKTIKSLIFVILVSVFLIYGFTENKPDPIEPKSTGPEGMLRFYENLHYPYGALLPGSVNERILKDVINMPDEKTVEAKALTYWTVKGPNFVNLPNSPTSNRTGRILDIEVENGASMRLAAASGGLWGFALIFPVSLSDNLNTLVVSSFDSHPGNANTILVGTGEESVRTGNGLWKTTNNGSSWTIVPLTGIFYPNFIYKVRYDPVNPNIIYVASDTGFFKSTNSGTSFTNIGTGSPFSFPIKGAFDFAVNPQNNQVIYRSLRNNGIYKSTDGGTSWAKLTAAPLPTTNVGRVSISIAASSPNTVYFNIARQDNDNTLSIYKTTDAGVTFTNVYSTEFMNGQGSYNNTISVCPTNPNLVLAGGVTLLRTSNGGTTWNDFLNSADPLYDPNNVHPDQHTIVWNAAGTTVWLGNDGGVATSTNAGLNWTTNINILPITQYINIDVGGKGTHIIGGTQDNGVSGTTNGGLDWWQFQGGDGTGIAIDPTTPSKYVITGGFYSTGNWSWRRKITTDNGATFTFIDNGIDPSTQWYTKIRNDKVAPPYLYCNSGNYVYISINYGANWSRLNATAFPVTITNLDVGKYSTTSVVYATLNSATDGQRLMVYDANAWYERTTGFPSGVKVQGVAQHPSNNNIAYALMKGLGSSQKVFKTINRGVSWTNVTGNLPNIPVTDLVPHPSDNNKLYLGTEYGCYKTTNAGITWYKWNSGMPNANLISEMTYIDSLANNSRFYIVAATYGRSIWMREITADDPVSGINSEENVTSFELMQNYPNPFNPTTEIKFALPFSDIVTIKVYDITGKEVATLINGKMEQGNHSVKFDGSELSSAVYFYRFSSSRFSDVKKMVLIK
ncbi:MAG: T9SS type A sorting domain-containing protein [Ignavibacteriota bacterium]|nr:T9SS type A sorting domain-containing protein [Ignavibacteriota bacterium]